MRLADPASTHRLKAGKNVECQSRRDTAKKTFCFNMKNKGDDDDKFDDDYYDNYDNDDDIN